MFNDVQSITLTCWNDPHLFKEIGGLNGGADESEGRLISKSHNLFVQIPQPNKTKTHNPKKPKPTVIVHATQKSFENVKLEIIFKKYRGWV